MSAINNIRSLPVKIKKLSRIGSAIVWASIATIALADVGDPQVGTDHPWYPGELACSTFDRLFQTQAEVYRRVTGIDPHSQQDQALASWLWRNTHYWHGEEGAEDLWGQGFTGKGDLRTREYWTGLFAYGCGLCGTTHSQWIGEFEARFGHNRARCVNVEGHNSFEVLLSGGRYAGGKWVLLDHDVSTVVFGPDGQTLLSIPEVRADWKRLTDRRLATEKQNGWLVCGLSAEDGAAYRRYDGVEYLAGYSGPPPIVHLRRGEFLRRYLEPGLEDGRTIVFWGRNYRAAGIPGPERSRTWVNQPEKMHGSRNGSGFKEGQARFANAVYVYRPDFAGPYREGVIDESEDRVTFEFYTPYIIAATPADDSDWGIYEPGCKNGLLLGGSADCGVSISVNQGRTWRDGGTLRDGLDLTDAVKGHRQYFLRFSAGAKQLAASGLTMTTVCQANSSVLPRLKDGETRVTFAASGNAIISAGPNLPQAEPHIVAGRFGSPNVTLDLKPPRDEAAVAVYAAAHVMSSNPPDPEVKYQIEYSTDAGRTWKTVVRDWSITRRGDEPADFWSQSFCWGSAAIDAPRGRTIQVRFHNHGGKNYARCEAHLVYRSALTDSNGSPDATRVTFVYSDDSGLHQASHIFDAAASPSDAAAAWNLSTGENVRTHWIELAPVPAPSR
jgi:hypothetical protein